MSKKPRKTSPKPEKYITESIKVDKFIPGGQAIATLESGKKIFLWGALPGEVVTKVRVTKEKSSFVEGIAEEIAQKSVFRVEPKDKCYLATSPWQILSEEYENNQKDEILREIFRQHAIEIPEALRDFHIASNVKFYHYRNKMEYALYYSHEDAKIHLAFHERGSHRKTPIEQSSLERPEIWKKAIEIIDELNHRGEDARKYQSLLLRCNQEGEVGGGLFENHCPRPKFAKLEDELFGINYKYSPNGFFQINLPVYEQVLEVIRKVYSKKTKNQSVLDLYSGVGTIGLSVAPNSKLTLVECDKSAYAEMVENAKSAMEATSNPNIKPVLAKSEDVLGYVEPDQTVIVDPPRAGCMPEVIERFLEVEPERIIYLSCNPATQARDIKRLLEKYEISLVQPYNFFPRTPHIENLIILDRKK